MISIISGLLFFTTTHVMSSQHKHVFVHQEALTWYTYQITLSNRVSAWECVAECKSNHSCLGFIVQSCSEQLCQCTMLGKRSKDQLQITSEKHKGLWVKQCPDGYESVPADAVPPRCYRFHTHTRSTGLSRKEAKEVCRETGGQQSRLVNLESIKEFHAMKKAMVKWLSGMSLSSTSHTMTESKP